MVKHMRYREFMDWCNQRAANGEWGMSEAIKCIATIGIIRKNRSGEERQCGKLLCTRYYF